MNEQNNQIQLVDYLMWINIQDCMNKVVQPFTHPAFMPCDSKQAFFKVYKIGDNIIAVHNFDKDNQDFINLLKELQRTGALKKIYEVEGDLQNAIHVECMGLQGLIFLKQSKNRIYEIKKTGVLKITKTQINSNTVIQNQIQKQRVEAQKLQSESIRQINISKKSDVVDKNGLNEKTNLKSISPDWEKGKILNNLQWVNVNECREKYLNINVKAKFSKPKTKYNSQFELIEDIKLNQLYISPLANVKKELLTLARDKQAIKKVFKIKGDPLNAKEAICIKPIIAVKIGNDQYQVEQLGELQLQ